MKLSKDLNKYNQTFKKLEKLYKLLIEKLYKVFEVIRNLHQQYK
jgi:flagellar motility protein MotE (MotC chaperone)